MRIHDPARRMPALPLRVWSWAPGPDHPRLCVPGDKAGASWRRVVAHWPRLHAALQRMQHLPVVAPVPAQDRNGACSLHWRSESRPSDLVVVLNRDFWLWRLTELFAAHYDQPRPPWEIPADVAAWLPRARPITQTGSGPADPQLRTGWIDREASGRWRFDLDADS